MSGPSPNAASAGAWARVAAGAPSPGGNRPGDDPPPPPKFEPVRAPDLVRLYPEMRERVIEGLVRAGEVMNLVAPPKVGKTWLVLLLAVSVALGRTWLGKATTAGRVLIIDAELHRETFARRLASMLASVGVAPADLTDRLDIWPVRGLGLDVHSIAAALSAVPKGRYRVIVLDALYRFLPPGCEENSNEDMTLIYNALDALAEATGAAIVVVHHTSKGAQGQKTVTDVGSGGGAQSRAPDTHLILRHHEELGAVVVEAVTRSWKKPDPFVIRWVNSGWQLAPDLDPSKLQKPKPKQGKTDAADKPPPPPVRQWTVEEFAAEIVGEVPSIREEIIARATAKSLSKTQAESLLKRAEQAGKVHRRKPGPSATHQFTSVPPNQPDLPQGGGEGASRPPPPEPCAPGGVGGPARPPSPPPPRGSKRAGRGSSTNQQPPRQSSPPGEPAEPGCPDLGGLAAAPGPDVAVVGPDGDNPVAVADAGAWTGPDDLPPDLREEFEERAAIMEFDGNLPRERAEALALAELRASVSDVESDRDQPVGGGA